MAKIRVSSFGIQALRPVTPLVKNSPTLPDWNDQIVPADWSRSINLETTYATTIATARKKQVEERWALHDRPVRVLTFKLTSVPVEQLEKMLHLMRYMNEAPFAVPLYLDVCELTEDYDGGTTVHLDVTKGRFFAGAYMAAQKGDEIAFRKVTERQPSYLKIDSALPWTGKVGEIAIFPAIIADQMMSSSIDLITDEIGTMTLTAHEKVGETALPPSWIGTPPGWDMFEGLPIFDPFWWHDWNNNLNISDARAGIHAAFGRGFYTELYGDAPKRQTSVSLLVGSREEFFKLLHLFDSRMGRLLPLWLVDAQGGWHVKEVGSGYVDVEARGDLSYLNEVKYLALTDKNGHTEIQEVGAVTDHNGDWRFSFSSSFSIATEDVVHCARARKARFQKDVLHEEAVTDEVRLVKMSFVELLKEVDQ